MSTSSSTLRLSQTQQLDLYYRAVIRALDPKTLQEIFDILNVSKSNSKSGRVTQYI